MKQLGCINAAAIAWLKDKNGKDLGHIIDTPNAVAYAMAINPRVETSKSIFTTRTREDLKDRFWFVVKDSEILGQTLVWY